MPAQKSYWNVKTHSALRTGSVKSGLEDLVDYQVTAVILKQEKRVIWTIRLNGAYRAQKEAKPLA